MIFARTCACRSDAPHLIRRQAVIESTSASMLSVNRGIIPPIRAVASGISRRDRHRFLTFPFVNVSADVLLLPFLLAQSSFHHASIAGLENRIILPPTLTNGIGGCDRCCARSPVVRRTAAL